MLISANPDIVLSKSLISGGFLNFTTMVQFDEYDLFFTDYTDSPDEYPDYVAIEDLELLNIRNKYHVIYFCDAYLKIFRLDKTIQNFQLIEKQIRLYKHDNFVYKKNLLEYVETNLSKKLVTIA